MYLNIDSKEVTKKLPVNVQIAKDQPQFNTLPAHRTSTGVVAVAFILTDEDIEKIKENKRIYYLQDVGTIQNITVKVKRSDLEEILEKNKSNSIALDISTVAMLQPINIAVDPADIEAAVEYSHELRLPKAGAGNVQ